MADNNPRKRRCDSIENESEQISSDSTENKMLKMDLEKKEIMIIRMTETLCSMQEVIENQSEELQSIRLKLEKAENDQENLKTSSAGKSFVLKHVIKNVSKMKDSIGYCSNVEEHFGVPWTVCLYSHDTHLGLKLSCEKSYSDEKWSIEADSEIKIFSKNGKNIKEKIYTSKKSTFVFGNFNGTIDTEKSGYHKIIEKDKIEKYLKIDNQLIILEVSVKINKTIGIYKEKLRCFDVKMEKISDVVLVVKEQKFYVSKLSLATHSSYFKSLFLGKSENSKNAEIKLSGIDADDFQNYLEVIYGEQPIDEITIEGLLLVADKYSTPSVIQKCEEFLVEKSEKSLKKRLEMAMRFDLNKLKEKCLSEIDSICGTGTVANGDNSEDDDDNEDVDNSENSDNDDYNSDYS